LFKSLKSLICNIPDVTTQEVDSLDEIVYTTKENIKEICIETKKLLTSMIVKDPNFNNSSCVESSIKIKESCYSSVIAIRGHTKHNSSKMKIYPCLEKIFELDFKDENDDTKVGSSITNTTPSAPSFDQVDSTKSATQKVH
jgi:hypothetical protein